MKTTKKSVIWSIAGAVILSEQSRIVILSEQRKFLNVILSERSESKDLNTNINF